MKVLNPVYSLESNWGFGTKSWSSETGSQWTVNNWWRCWKAPPCPRRRCWPYLTLLSMLLGSRFWCNIIPTTILPSQKLYFMEENINYHLTTLKWQWIKCLQNIRKEGVEWQFFPFLSRHVLNVSSLQSLNICLLQLLLILLLADLENWKENCFTNLSILLLPTYTCLCITLARMAANCSCVGQPMTVYWSRLYSGLAGLPPMVFAALDIDCNQADRAPWNRIFEEKYFINILYRVPEKSW